MKRSNLLLIRTKWSPPRVDARVLPRERLLGLLEAGREQRLTLLLGPAGSGKTTLAAQWRQRLIGQGCDVAWYNLGPDDTSLWAAYLIASLDAAGLEVSDEMLGLSERCDARSLEVLLALLVNAVYVHPRPLYLFLEDLHFLASLPALEMIQRLIDLAPDNFHLLISSRQRPGLDLLAIGVKGQLLQIDFADLRLSDAEQASLLTQHGVSSLSGAQQRRLYELTDGWVAGLQMSALSLRHGGDFERSFQGWCGASMLTDERGIDAYLDDCIVRVLQPTQIALMVQVSVCRRFNVELCAAISGDPQGGALLDILLEQNLFLLPIDSDDAQPWFRFHRMFAGYLGKRRSQLPPQEVMRINRAASVWFAAQGLYVEAIRHAQYAGDLASSVELLGRAARKLLNGAHFAQLLQLVDALPWDSWRGQIDLLLAVSWAELSCNRLPAFEQTLQAIVEHPAAAKFEVAFEQRLLRVMYNLKRDDTEAALVLLEPSLEQPPKASNFQLLMLYTLAGMALFKANQVGRTRDLVLSARHRLAQGHDQRPLPFLDVLRGMSFFMHGDMCQARHELEASLAELGRAPWLAEDAGLLIKATLALTCYALDDLEMAEQYLEDCIDLVEVLGTADAILYAFLAQARVHCAAGLYPAAMASLERFGVIAERLGLDRLQAWRLAEQVRIACVTAELPPAREALRRLRLLAAPYADKRACAWAEIPLVLAMAEADLALAEGSPVRTVELCAQWAQVCQDGELLLIATLLRLRCAVALIAADQEEAACAHGRVALRAASELGLNRIFLDEGMACVPLLESLARCGDLLPAERIYLQRCLERVAAPASVLLLSVQPGKPRTGSDLLSPRELEIVGLLSRALSTKSIARALSLSPGTVKWHLKNVFGKLDAFSREDAVLKARQLGLVS